MVFVVAGESQLFEVFAEIVTVQEEVKLWASMAAVEIFIADPKFTVIVCAVVACDWYVLESLWSCTLTNG